MNTVASFDAKFLEPMMRFVAKDDIRYYLKGIKIEPAPTGGVILAATCGHTLMVARDPNGHVEGEHIFSPSKPLAQAAKKRGMGKVHLSKDDALGVIMGEDWRKVFDLKHAAAAGKVEFIDAKFPDWRLVVPKIIEGDYCDMLINADYVARFHGAFDAMAGQKKGYLGVRLQAYTEHGSIVVRPETQVVDAIGLIMPRKGGREAFDAEWLGIKREKK